MLIHSGKMYMECEDELCATVNATFPDIQECINSFSGFKTGKIEHMYPDDTKLVWIESWTSQVLFERDVL